MSLEATNSFLEALKEIDALILLAKSQESNTSNYQAINKSNLVLLVVKFEVFIEDTALQYIEGINAQRLSPHKLPSKLKLAHFLERVERSWPLRAKTDNEVENICKNTGLLWGTHAGAHLSLLEVNTKFSFGKHGSGEIENLFKKIGFTNIFSNIPITKTTFDVSLAQDVEEKVDFTGTLDSLICIRHEIIHRDANPTVTPGYLEEKKNFLQQFAVKLDAFIDTQLAANIS